VTNPPRPTRPQARSQALGAALAYLAFGVAWILGSDRLIERLAEDAIVLSRLQSAKGIAFIAISAAAIYFIARLFAADEEPLPTAIAHSRRRPRLRFQLVLFAGAITLPLLLVLAYNIDREARRHQQSAEEGALGVAQRIAADTARMLKDARVAAEALAARADVRALDAARCDAQLVELPKLIPHIVNALTVGGAGELTCAARTPADASIAAWPQLETALASPKPIVGALARRPFSRDWVVPVAVGLRDDAGRPAGALLLALALPALPAARDPGTDATFVALIEARSKLVLREPPIDGRGVAPVDSPITRAAIAGRHGSGRAGNHDGVDTIYGHTPVEGTDWIALAGIPASIALAASRESAARLSMLGALLVIVTALVAYGIGRGIERPMRAVAVALRRYADGDAEARAPVAGSRETSEVAARANELLDRLPKLEAQLGASEHRLHTVLGAAQEGVIVYTPDERIVFINEMAAKLLGYGDATALIGDDVKEIMPPELRPGAAQRFAERRLGKADRYEARISAADGTERWLFVSATPLATPAGAFEGVLAVLYDITERKEVEERLARVTRLYWALSKVNEAVVRTSDRMTLFSTMCDIVVHEGGFVSAFVTMLDGSEPMLLPVASCGATSGVIGREPISIEPGSLHANVALATAVRTGEPQIVNDFFADPRTKPARGVAAQLGIRSSAAFPLRCEGVVVGALAVYAPDVGYFDIGLTELMHQIAADASFALDVYTRAAARDRAESEVRELAADLERRVAERTARLTEANRELEAFSYSVSHDLRAPVRAINGFAQILSSHAESTLDDEGRRLLGNIVRSSAHMGRLIDDLLAFAQLGRSAIELRPVSLVSVFDRASDELKPVIEARGADLDIDGEMASVRGDPTLLHQVFLNLFSNALAYAKPQVAPRIRVRWRDVGDRLEISVQDNGIGIEPEDQQRIFDMFVRLHSGKAHPGTGIGLALAAKAAALMYGEIRVESELGEGAIFRVLLPQARGMLAEEGEKAYNS
jgi:PAS domain S-box-containing protein